MLPEDEEPYPNLISRGYEMTSPVCSNYNCVAWAADWDSSRWWGPEENEPGVHWPDGVPRGNYIENYMQVFARLGFIPCDGPELEDGFDKIAFWDDRYQWRFGHVARQLPNGKWASKLGDGNDIIHNTLDAVNCELYPCVYKYMKRPFSNRPENYQLPPNLRRLF